MNVVLCSDDMLLLEHWEKSINRKCTLVYELDELYSLKDSLVILDYSVCNSMCEQILSKLKIENRVLILDRTPNIEIVKSILRYGAKGYGNALMRDHFIVSAVETIMDGMVWLYPEFTTMLIENISSNKENDNTLKLNVLSDREKEVALLLKDGETYKEVAQKLSITPRTVKAHAKHIYTKLAVKDRLALALLLK